MIKLLNTLTDRCSLEGPGPVIIDDSSRMTAGFLDSRIRPTHWTQGRLNHVGRRGLGPRFSRYSVNPAESQLLLHDRKNEFAVRVVYIRRHAARFPPRFTGCPPVSPAHGGRLTSMGRHARRFSPLRPRIRRRIVLAAGSICPYLSVCPRDFFPDSQCIILIDYSLRR